MRVRQVAHRLQIVLKAVVHRHQRDLDQLRLAIDDALEVLEVDASVAGHHDAHVEALPFQLHQVHQRPFEVQRIGDDVAIEPGQAEAFDDEVFAGAGVGDVADLARLRVD